MLLHEAANARSWDVDDLIPAATTVLVRWGGIFPCEILATTIRRLLNPSDRAVGDWSDYPDDALPVRESHLPAIVVPVIYDGKDLTEVARLAGMSVNEVVARHVGAEYLVAFAGFAPGFSYLSGGDPALVVPRRDTPRTRIPAGSVGLAGPYSGVYPRESPGGWQLIGRTTLTMWDLDREPPALLEPGRLVRFEVHREHVVTSTPDAVPEAPASPEVTIRAAKPKQLGAPLLKILEPGLQTLVQDTGRPGYASLGVGRSGAADRGSLLRANRSAGNKPHAAALEIGPGRFVAEAQAIAVLAFAGAQRPGRIRGPHGERKVVAGRAFRIDVGETLELGATERGMRTMLGVRGGVCAATALGSASRDTLSGIGPEPLAAGDLVSVGNLGTLSVGSPEADIDSVPAVGEETQIDVVLGPRDDWFESDGVARFLETVWEVTPQSDRVGLRLAGAALTRGESFRDLELMSEGLAPGSIQVPPDGQPVLFLADRPLTGGYPIIGVLPHHELDRAAQLPPGSFVRFRPIAPQACDVQPSDSVMLNAIRTLPRQTTEKAIR